MDHETGITDEGANFERVESHRPSAERLVRRNKYLLWMLMKFDIYRYLMSNTHGRLDGAEKAQRHINLCNAYLSSQMFCSTDDIKFSEEPDGMAIFRKIYDDTQELTSYMDEVIGFPIDGKNPDLEKLAPLFFDKFLEMADKSWREA